MVAVHDGDTITVLVEKTQTKIRLAGIDAPELKQDFGNVAKRTLSELVFGRNVRVVDKGKDRYGRTIGDVYEGEKRVNLILVEKGMAWVYLR